MASRATDPQPTGRPCPVPKIMLNIVDKDDSSYSQSKSPTDLGIPAISMPNLSLDVARDGAELFGHGSDHRRSSKDDSDQVLRVYCSPRMSRRSANLQPAKKETAEGLCWLTTALGPSNHLHDGSRVGSSVSLNSDCTARSIGLISNDSSDNTSYLERLGDLGSGGQRSYVLRRHLSNPEHSPEVIACMQRNCRSWSNLKEGPQETVPEDILEKSTEGDEKQSEASEFSMSLPSCRSEAPQQSGRAPPEKVGDAACRSPLVRARVGSKALQEGRIKHWLQQVTRTGSQGEQNFEAERDEYYS